MTTPVIYLVLLDSDDQVKKFAKFYKLEDGSSIYDGPPIFGSVDLEVIGPDLRDPCSTETLTLLSTNGRAQLKPVS
jgi:hypothetical protein